MNLIIKKNEINTFLDIGSCWGVYTLQVAKKNPKIKTFCTATDGNHGRAVAWMARKLGRKALIYMPNGTVPARVEAIEKAGKHFNLRCPLTGEYKVGENWSETH